MEDFGRGEGEVRQQGQPLGLAQKRLRGRGIDAPQADPAEEA